MVGWVSLIVFLVTSGLVFAVYLVLNRDDLRMASRVRRLGESAGPGRPAAAWVADLIARLPLSSLLGEQREARLRQRMVRAGLYGPGAASVFLAARILLTAAGAALGLGAGLSNIVPPNWKLPACLVLVGFGVLLPGLWLDARISAWQKAIRRGLPDTMDMLVLC
ncbi:MAG: hypothetical protein ACRC33_17915, partial [Gemmataceae bacterium]